MPPTPTVKTSVVMQKIIWHSFLFVFVLSTVAFTAEETDSFIGRWVRIDGSYLLEIKAINDDDSIEAAYFNPKPINVVEAKVVREEDKVGIFVKLRDVHYPGSYYALNHYEEKDSLYRPVISLRRSSQAGAFFNWLIPSAH